MQRVALRCNGLRRNATGRAGALRRERQHRRGRRAHQGGDVQGHAVVRDDHVTQPSLASANRQQHCRAHVMPTLHSKQAPSCTGYRELNPEFLVDPRP